MLNKKYFRFFAGFALAILLITVVGSITYFTLKRQEKEQFLVQHTYQVINTAGFVETVCINMQTGVRGYRATGNKEFLDPYTNSGRDLRGTLSQLRSLVIDNPVQVKRARKLAEVSDDLDSFWLATNESVVTTYEEMYSRTHWEKGRMDEVRNLVAAIQDEERVLLDKREKESAAVLQQTIWWLLIGDVLVLLIVAALIRLILAEYSVRAQAEEQLKDNLAELSRINEETTEKNWLLNGMREINAGIISYGSLQSLMDNCLKRVTDYTGAVVGAFYFHKEKESILQLIGSVALPAGVATTLRINEGVVGAAATQRRVVVIRDVPESYWHVSSATGAAKPQVIVCVPLWVNDDLLGIMELGCFGSQSDRIAQLLSDIADNIAMALKGADASDRLYSAMAKVQEQKEELESQQEELRQTNEELTQQAEVLRASEEELKTQEEELRQINDELESKTRAVEASSEQLKVKAQELEISSKYKSEFLANMSHELRTPLNSVLILANILSENKQGNLDEKQIEYARIIHRSGNDLLTLINDILDLSKIEAGKVEMHFEQVSVDDIVRDMQSLFAVMARERKIGFDVKVDEDVPESICTDKMRLEQVIKNLLSNAFKFTNQGGVVTLLFSMVDADLSISVRDTGIGIAAEKQALIFEAFQQADGATTRKYGGTGLGLSISKELVSRLRGNISLRSEEGRGSEFAILLRLTGEVAVDEGGSSSPATVDISDMSVDAQLEVPDDKSVIRVGEQSILIIEDDVVFAGILNSYAHQRGFKTLVALKGDEGYWYAKKYKPSAIILDLGLPVIDGRHILRMLKADDELKHIPVHVITADDRADVANSGVESYFRKPIEQKDLEQTFFYIESYLRERYRNVLILSRGDGELGDMFSALTGNRREGVIYEVVDIPEKAIAAAATKKHDCIIIDIAGDIKVGISLLEQLKSIAKPDTYIITCLDRDISGGDEKLLKTYSNSIIRKSGHAAGRLIDEVELFLHKVKTTKSPSVPGKYNQQTDGSLSGKKVLLADDDMRNIFSLAALLEEQGMHIVTAENGREALEQLEANADIDIVLMDIMMPEMDGFEAMRLMRAQQRYARLPIIALTAKAMTGDREKCLEAGASDYITKPIDAKKLFSLMRVWLSSQ